MGLTCHWQKSLDFLLPYEECKLESNEGSSLNQEWMPSTEIATGFGMRVMSLLWSSAEAEMSKKFLSGQARVWRGAGMEPSALSVSTSASAPVVPGECRFLIVNVLNATE